MKRVAQYLLAGVVTCAAVGGTKMYVEAVRYLYKVGILI